MASFLHRLRQWGYPPELRIPVTGNSSGSRDLAALLTDQFTDLAARCRELEARSETPDPGVPATAAGLDRDLALGLANGLFRVERNLDQLLAEGSESKETRSIRSASRRLRELLGARGVESRDLTGDPPHDGRLDFEQLGPPQVVPGLEKARIARLERPVVVLDGQLIQTARGVVEIPA